MRPYEKGERVEFYFAKTGWIRGSIRVVEENADGPTYHITFDQPRELNNTLWTGTYVWWTEVNSLLRRLSVLELLAEAANE